ncbi:MED14-domain-containing protein [Hypoxylon sp. NC1633]|nr:MED14-domain-containing protein [Hypoxylon sp. NC1633]
MMPGVVMMENGVRAQLLTNHDRDHDLLVNGNASLDRKNGIPAGAGAANTMANGDGNGDGTKSAQPQRSNTDPSRMNDLPDEIQHITQGFIPLGLLLSRLAQKTHNQLADEIMVLSKMPAPAPAVNGNSAHVGVAIDDASSENLGKKARLLNFVQEKHAEWVKAAVITRWSRNAQSVSKLIDLMFLINMQRARYEELPREMARLKGSLTFARLPNPDLQTALHVLSGGTAPWMPELNYVNPPPLTLKEQLQWIENLNTLLSIRLNLEDYDNIPYHFRNYTIDSGRVTFKVPGEFEVDLTIADEDFDKQFWFIDFRFSFTPAPAELSDSLRMYMESKVNDALEKDGLAGCYKFLHEFVLTHKIGEYVRQALEMSRGRWVDTLKVERLNRAMGIQYWVGRFPPEGPKSWIILGVHSGKKANALDDPTLTSYLTLRWFRDNQEVKDVDISFDDANISTEDLLNSVIGRHIGYFLGTIHSRLMTQERFVKRELGLTLDERSDDPTRSSLNMQLGHDYYLNLGFSSTTGMFSLKPQTPIVIKGEHTLNVLAKDPIQDACVRVEGIRRHYVAEEIKRRGKTMAWFGCRWPVKLDNIKEMMSPSSIGQILWMKRLGWTDEWFLMINLSMTGNSWYLIKVDSTNKGRITNYTQIPLDLWAPKLDDQFFSRLNVFTSAMISNIIDMSTLQKRRVKHLTLDSSNLSIPPGMRVPTIFVRLSDLLRQQLHPSERRTASWAYDFVQIMFKAVRNPSAKPRIADEKERTTDGAGEGAALQKQSLHTYLEARIKVSDPSRFALLKGHVERDVAFSRRLGVFALRLEAVVGNTVLDTLAHRVQAIDKLADCIDAIRRSDRDIQCEEITLTRIVVTYTDRLKSAGSMAAQPHKPRYKAILILGVHDTQIFFERGNPQLRSLDLFRHLISSDLRCSQLPFFLSSTLPIQRALDAIKDAWENFALNNQGRVEVIAAHLDWFNIHYYLPGPNRNSQTLRRLSLQVRLKQRVRETEWHVFREEPGEVKDPDDEFKQALEKVWSAEGKGWESLGASATTKTDHRVGELIKAVDEAVRRLALQSPTVLKHHQPKSQVQAKGPAQAMYHKAMVNKARPQSGQVVVLDD